jgi:hypothetical protein
MDKKRKSYLRYHLISVICGSGIFHHFYLLLRQPPAKGGVNSKLIHCLTDLAVERFSLALKAVVVD